MNNSRIRSLHDRQYKEIVTALAKARKAAGISQSAVSLVVGLAQPDISKIESLERRLDIVEFLTIATYIGSRSGESDLVDKLIGKAREL